MITIRKNEPLGTEADGTPISRMEIDVDTAEELPVKIKGVKLGQGSIAWVISTGEFYGLTSDGEWINQSNPDTATASEVTLSAAPMRMMSAVKTETVEPESEVVENESLRETESTEDGASE